MKRGQGNVMWILVVAIIVLVAGAILIVMFSGRTGDTNTALQNCESKGGVCEIECTGATLPAGAFSCPNKDTKKQVCCIGLS
jgi:hypothetical protein